MERENPLLLAVLEIQRVKNGEDIKPENGKAEATTASNDGSLCGFDSLHRLLQASLSPQVFQVIIIQSIFLLF